MENASKLQHFCLMKQLFLRAGLEKEKTRLFDFQLNPWGGLDQPMQKLGCWNEVARLWSGLDQADWTLDRWERDVGLRHHQEADRLGQACWAASSSGGSLVGRASWAALVGPRH
ncbi:hypothetical protein M9H77_30264 [Catharanthus roseus]|uniref:Uncharacterized protein n=1 Tax=Catharanthus roseus TaxID=4058 RepID=A0ACB9ZY27_CATRO|nr:hypothetical protein M9H77_30264 [Catharanthus roseus]